MDEDEPLVSKRRHKKEEPGFDLRARSCERASSSRSPVKIQGALPPVPPDNGLGDVTRPADFQGLVNKFRDAEDRVTKKKDADGRAASSSGRRPSDRRASLGQDQLIALEEMQRLVREMTKKASDDEARAESAESLLARTEERLSAEVTARRDAEQLRAHAVGRVEELELMGLQFQSEREEWRQREADLQEQASQGQNMVQDWEARERGAIDSREERIRELEALLKQAIVRGAKLGRARTEVETTKADLERKFSKFKAGAKARVRRERRRLEAMVAAMAQRAERAEDRLVEYLDASCQGADALAEAHMRHLIETSYDLAEKVDEQADIIDALRGLLQDHKDFIRAEMAGSLHFPAQAPAPPPSKQARVKAAPAEKPEPAALTALRKLELEDDNWHEPGSPAMEDELSLLELNVESPERRTPKGLPPAPLESLDLGDSTDSFDEEIFGTRRSPSSGVQHPEVMPQGSVGKAGPARTRSSKVEEDPWDW